MLFGVGVAPDEDATPAVRASLDAMIASMSRLATGMYLNFTERKVDPAVLYGEETYRRLQAMRAEVDPDSLFRANHSIPAGRSA